MFKVAIRGLEMNRLISDGEVPQVIDQFIVVRRIRNALGKYIFLRLFIVVTLNPESDLSS